MATQPKDKWSFILPGKFLFDQSGLNKLYTFNLITLAVNSGMSEKSRTDNASLIVMFVFVSLIVLVNIVVVFGLMKGKQTREKLLKGLIQMYKDQDVDKYYDMSLLGNYNVRYNLFIMVVMFTGVIAAIVPFILR